MWGSQQLCTSRYSSAAERPEQGFRNKQEIAGSPCLACAQGGAASRKREISTGSRRLDGNQTALVLFPYAC
jgi:hypothetical protein